jgi:hypothetical protein
MAYVRPAARRDVAIRRRGRDSQRTDGSSERSTSQQIVIKLTPAASYIGTDQLTSTGMAIIGLSTLLLIAACANLANMLFARGASARVKLR